MELDNFKPVTAAIEVQRHKQFDMSNNNEKQEQVQAMITMTLIKRKITEDHQSIKQARTL